MPSASTRMPCWRSGRPTSPGTGRRAQHCIARHLDPALAHQLTQECWHGAANRLSRDEPVRWEVIDEVAAATRKPAGEVQGFDTLETPVLESNGHASADGPLAGQIILQRRSLLACDGRTSIAAERFYRMLARVMPRVELPASQRPMPWDAMAWDPTDPPRLVRSSGRWHRARAVPARSRPGQDGQAEARDARSASTWSTPPGCPADLPLRMLEAGDAQAARDAAQLPPGHRRRRRLLARHDRRVPGGAVHAWGLVLSAAVLGRRG